MTFLWFLVSAVVITYAAADYDCLCNYNVELEVHNEMTDSSTPVGSLYEFDCKEQLTAVTVTTGWAAIAYEHNIRYVKTGPNTETQMCPGNAPDSDKVIITTTGSPVTTTTTVLPTTVTTTPIPTTVTTTSIPTTTTSVPVPTTTTTTSQPTSVTTTPVPTTYTTTTTSTTVTTPPMSTTVSTTPQPTTVTTTPVPTTTTTTPTTTTPMITWPGLTFTPSSTTSSTTYPPTTTTAQAGIIAGHTNLCPVALRSFTSQDRGFLAQYDKSCYELVPHSLTWADAESDCKTKGAHLVQINTQGEQDFIYDLIRRNHNTNTWIGLHDLNRETYYEWTSGETVVYTNWLHGQPPHSSAQDCVYLNPHDGGHWDDHACAGGGFLTFTNPSTGPYICQYEIDTNAQGNGSVNHHGDGNTHMCPSTVVQHASKYHGILGQYGQSCYEVLPRYDVSWQHGEQLCRQEGGHLAHIANADEQSFIQEFMTNHMPTHGAWIGLNDRASEGHFVWSSGNAVAYTNWAKGHTGNWDSPGREDCALFLPYANGHWDDLPCGSSSGFLGDFGESHPIICQFGLSHVSPAVG